MERSTHTHTHLISSLVCFPAEADPLGIMLKCFGVYACSRCCVVFYDSTLTVAVFVWCVRSGKACSILSSQTNE